MSSQTLGQVGLQRQSWAPGAGLAIRAAAWISPEVGRPSGTPALPRPWSSCSGVLGPAGVKPLAGAGGTGTGGSRGRLPRGALLASSRF